MCPAFQFLVSDLELPEISAHSNNVKVTQVYEVPTPAQKAAFLLANYPEIPTQKYSPSGQKLPGVPIGHAHCPPTLRYFRSNSYLTLKIALPETRLPHASHTRTPALQGVQLCRTCTVFQPPTYVS
ncbi:hypothetical protein SAMN05660282_00846 [Corynebacterium spheniscorum]|uniref:Uncharacterized protein n=1 Tax=Corynebacterium spheniscorum TaxID=185761 RepID=A0A1I2RYW7_9CORY|nr:hypothetical protein SAMN05660282_00846 [Corynebacterium spheniscorum]